MSSSNYFLNPGLESPSLQAVQGEECGYLPSMTVEELCLSAYPLGPAMGYTIWIPPCG